MVLYQLYQTFAQFVDSNPDIESVHIQPVKHVALNDPIVVFQLPSNGITF